MYTQVPILALIVLEITAIDRPRLVSGNSTVFVCEAAASLITPEYFKVAFKPVATVIQKQETIDKDGNIVTLMGKGRHDPCVVPRAIPIVEALAAMVMLDNIKLDKASRI